MPTYVYQCKQCEQTFEVEQRITEDPLKDCRCGKKGSLKRLIQPVAVMFNGSGFHVNDYASHGLKQATPKSEPKSEAAGPCGNDSCACKTSED